MHKLKAPILILAILLSGISTISAQKKDKNAKKDEQFKEMTNLIESGHYLFTVQSVNPTGSRTIHTTTDYTLEANDSTYKAYLPYFGRAYQASYGGDGGIEFDASPENLELTLKEKKRTINIEFEIQAKNDKYSCFLSVGSSGYSTLSINSNNRQPISYSGIVGPLKEKKEKKEEKEK